MTPQRGHPLGSVAGMGLDAMEPEARPEPPLHLAPRPSEFATETGPPDVLIRDETDSASVGTTAGVNSSGTSELVEYVYAALLERLQAHCRHVLSVAESEAETVRTRAQEEARHIVADAHREQLMLLSKASAKQALMYQEAEADIDRWLDELEEQRVAVLAAARGEYDGLVGKRFEAADREARRII